LFGGDESPSLTPTAAKGAPQERGFLEELFGPDEEPKPAPVAKPAPAERAPKVEEIIPNRPIGGDRTTEVSPVITKEPAVETPPHLGGGKFELEPQKATPEQAPAQRTAASTGTWHDDPVIKESRARMEQIRANPPQNSFQLQYYKDALAREDAIIKDRKEEIKYEQSGHIGVLYKDKYGRPVMGYTSGPKLGQPFEAPAGPSAGDKKTAPVEKNYEKDKWGNRFDEKFLGSLDPVLQDEVQAIVKGNKARPPRSKNAELVEAVTRYAPDYKENLYSEKKAQDLDYNAKTTLQSAGGQMVAANTGLDHAVELSRITEDLHNKGGILGKAMNAFEHRSFLNDDPAGRAWRFNRDTLTEELTKLFKGGMGSAGEIAEKVKNLDVSNSPAEIHRTLEQATKLLTGRTNYLAEKYARIHGVGEVIPGSEASVAGAGDFETLTKRSNDAMDEIRKRNNLYNKERREEDKYIDRNTGKPLSEKSEGPSIPPADKREIGKVYTNPNGASARWTDHGWERI
jgi:hypothetical protein